jgi:hypothetical protein
VNAGATNRTPLAINLPSTARRVTGLDDIASLLNAAPPWPGPALQKELAPADAPMQTKNAIYGCVFFRFRVIGELGCDW